MESGQISLQDSSKCQNMLTLRAQGERSLSHPTKFLLGWKICSAVARTVEKVNFSCIAEMPADFF